MLLGSMSHGIMYPIIARNSLYQLSLTNRMESRQAQFHHLVSMSAIPKCNRRLAVERFSIALPQRVNVPLGRP
jgi:hypothetical protein